MNNQDRINEIEKELAKITHHVMNLKKEKEFLTPSSFKFQGKFIKHTEKGYMYVVSQCIFQNKIYLQGFSFIYATSSCDEGFRLSSNTASVWYFNQYSLESDLMHGKIEELSKEEFIKCINEELSNYTKLLGQRLEKCIEKSKHNDDM